MSTAQHTPGPLRLKGHRRAFQRTGVQSLAVKPCCSCGWCGRAGERTTAIAQHEAHKRAAIAKATGSAA